MQFSDKNQTYLIYRSGQTAIHRKEYAGNTVRRRCRAFRFVLRRVRRFGSPAIIVDEEIYYNICTCNGVLSERMR